jgi:glycerol-3-phosphate dehydrogenase subunit C
MTTTYDPFHPKYLDEGDLRQEMNRVYDLCHGCRLCFKFCTSFPTLFEAIDRHDDQDSEKMTTAEQDQVVDECFQCKLCYINCPYTPGQHEWELDFPRLMMRAEQVLHRERSRSIKTKLTDKALGDTDLAGRIGTATAPITNRAIGTPGSPPRQLMEKVVGISAERILPPFARERFTTWFRKRKPTLEPSRPGIAALFPTCLVEYQDTQVGKDVVRVYERNGIECRVPEGQVCCGAPLLHQGDLDGFRARATQNVETLSTMLRHAHGHGEDVAIVVPQPTCGYVLKKDYVDYVGGADAALVADHTYDAAEYLMKVHRDDKAAGGAGLDVEFTGPIPETTTYHAPCHLRAQNVGLKSRDLIKLTGTKITLVAECSAIDGTWGLREENLERSRKVASKMAADMQRAASEQIAGDCTLANGGIQLETGQRPVHPISLVARAYGIPEEDR